MKNIIVLVDFSATADNALDQAIAVSDSESSITVCHVKGLSSEESHESEMAEIGIWATDATARLLGFDIIFYAKVGDGLHWVHYPALFDNALLSNRSLFI